MFFDSVKRINNIADDLLNDEKSKMSVNFKYEELINLIEKIVIEKEIEYAENISFHILKTENIKDAIISCSKSELSRIISNIINNSFDAKSKNCVIKFKVEVQNQFIQISISDSGQGIPENLIHKIGKEKTTNKINGHGIGLMSANEYIKSINGHFHIKNNPAGGCTVSLFLPVISWNH